MTYFEGSAAPQLEADELARVIARPAVFTSVEGGGVDASAREGVSPSFVQRAVLVVALVVMLCAIGATRVALTANTVTILQSNEAISSQIKEIRTTNSGLQIERSIYSGSERVGRIATQNLGMVHASEVERLDLD